MSEFHFFRIYLSFHLMPVFVSVWEFVQMSTGACGVQRVSSDPLELDS